MMERLKDGWANSKAKEPAAIHSAMCNLYGLGAMLDLMILDSFGFGLVFFSP